MSTSPEADVLARFLSHVNAAGIPHMVTGSLASISYSQPRATQDVDLIIDPSREQLEALVGSLKPDEYYVSPEAAREAFESRSMFNIIEFAGGWKIDLILLKRQPFDAEKFNRRIERETVGLRVPMVTREDSILSKLEWRKDSQSERQYRDVVNVATSQWDHLDFTYLRHWAAELGVSDDLERALADADQLRPQ